MINYDIAYSKVAHKYIFRVFYKRTNKKEYELQIFIPNISHINVIAIENIILMIIVLDISDKKTIYY